ncbi:hypothetical protein [Xanthomonas phage OP1]|uniref:Uncharacterized protein n=1 Tax=Xanthomonas phage OP1 TaxID=2994040 RepID=Q2NPE6_9CAUD|nr:hypothetical protein OP1_ORF45 [Xanthomonas phage OP1]BAE72750.1 hypothetical protein [Xanthomonas phage OP1]
MSLLLYKAQQLWNSVADAFLSHTGGWVVVAVPDDNEIPTYHAVGGGRDFGMDYATGRFPNRKAALAYANFRSSPKQEKCYGYGCTFQVQHETRATIKLLGDEYEN